MRKSGIDHSNINDCESEVSAFSVEIDNNLLSNVGVGLLIPTHLQVVF